MQVYTVILFNGGEQHQKDNRHTPCTHYLLFGFIIYFDVLLCLVSDNLNTLFRWKLQYLKSEFRGQLPKPYADGVNATNVIPSEMNDKNLEELTRYVSTVK